MQRRLKTQPNKTVRVEDDFGLKILKPDSRLPKGYLSKSQIEMYLRCGAQYEFRYIMGKKMPPSLPMTEGSAHGNTLNYNNLNFIAKGKHVKFSILIEKFVDELETLIKDMPKEEWKNWSTSKDGVILRGSEMQKDYFNKYGSILKPVGVEVPVEVMMGGVPVLGYIDMLEKNAIHDYKVVSRVYRQEDAHTDLQLSIYAKGAKHKNVSFICFDKNKEQVFQVPSTRNSGDFKAADAVVAGVVNGISKGVFPMTNPKNTFPCSQKFCGFWHQCRGKHLGR